MKKSLLKIVNYNLEIKNQKFQKIRLCLNKIWTKVKKIQLFHKIKAKVELFHKIIVKVDQNPNQKITKF